MLLALYCHYVYVLCGNLGLTVTMTFAFFYCKCRPEKTARILAVLSVLHIVFSDSLSRSAYWSFGRNLFAKEISYYSHQFWADALYLQEIFRIGAIAIGVVVLIALQKFGSGWVRRFGLPSLIALLLVLGVLSERFRFSAPLVSAAMIIQVTVLYRLMWGWLVMHRTAMQPQSWEQQVLFVMPFWRSTVVLGPMLWQPREQTDKERDRNRVDGARFLLLSLVALRAVNSAGAWLAKEGLPDTIGFAALFDQGLSPGRAWLILLGKTLLYIVGHLALFANLPFLSLKVLGFDAQSNFDRPWKATSFHDFYNRIMAYYVTVLKILFLEPTFRLLSFLRIRKLRIFVTVWISVFASGLVFHFFRDQRAIVALGLKSSLNFFAQGYLVYLVLLSSAISVSVILPWSSDSTSWPRKWLLPLGVFIVYALLIAWAFNADFEGVGSRLEFFRVLLLFG